MNFSLYFARFHHLVKEGSWIIAGQIVAALGALMLVRVLTEYLEPSQYGQLALGLTVAGLVNQVAMGGVMSSIGRFYSIAAEANDLPGYLSASRRLMIYPTAAVFAIILVLWFCMFWLDYSQWIGLTTAALVFSLLSSYNASLSSIQNAARQRAMVAIHGGLDAWLKILLAVGVIFWLGSSSTAVVVGYALSSLLVTGSQLFFLRRLICPQASRAREHQKWEQQMWQFSWPMMVGGLFNWSYYASQRWGLELFTTTEEVGQFYLLTQIAYSPISMAGGILSTFIVPILFARTGAPGNYERVKNTQQIVMKIAFVGFGATLGIAAISYFMHEKLFEVFVAQQYRNVSIYMPFVIFAAGLLQVSMAVSLIVSIKNETNKFIYLSVIGNSMFTLANLYATSSWGLHGLIISMSICAFIHLLWNIVLGFRNLQI